MKKILDFFKIYFFKSKQQVIYIMQGYAPPNGGLVLFACAKRTKNTLLRRATSSY